ncbi:metallophosphoesterase family protein [Parasulfitobacter algicola]|uniref:Serine/threonine protein phosphatase n=1 Tax=Parasulfitobacter algicola TaxID=2614809 RepID=A0ABX2IMZ4_9RHOB|nr:metallophosphoesterase family protein [Sulfitobacter algicola]NSX54256.1 serine/threonine protein phosphatase [Sulfitobacter algicola]
MLYAIGDIHGQIEMLESALDLIHADGGPDAEIVFLGDYVDRGPDSRSVLDTLINGVNVGKPWTCLKGNHDRMFEWFLEDHPIQDPHLFIDLHWLHDRLGGLETLASYGLETKERRRLGDLHDEARCAVPQAHIDFLKNLPLVHESDDLQFVHAGIRPGIAMQDQAENDLLWIREEFVTHTDPHHKLIVHGHTALDHPEHFGNRIDLDGGAGYGRPLIPAVFEGADCWVLKQTGRAALKATS